MSESKADLIIHPVRMRIIQTMVGGRQMTSQQLAEELKDVPHATLYRHIQKLAKGGILVVVDEIPNRGAVERIYALSTDAHTVSATDLKNASADDHMRYFVTFMASLLDAFDRYLEGGDVDLARDLVGYRMVDLYLTHEETVAMLKKIGEAMSPFLVNQPSPGRRKRTLGTVLIPGTDSP